MEHSEACTDWQYITREFEILEASGRGSYGTVVRGKHRVSGQIFAIKHIKNVFSSPYYCKTILREIEIMRKFTQMENNFFTTKLYDIVLPISQESDLSTLSSIFLIMDYVPLDLEKLF
jgi:serine/threonine protein kinase